MQVYRIAKKRYRRDLSGSGARLYGGRWNKKGTALIDTSESRSLATLEYLVHASSLSSLPIDLYLACMEIPDSITPKQIPKAPYWVVTNNDTPKKKRMLEDVLRILGYSKAAIEEAVSALY